MPEIRIRSRADVADAVVFLASEKARMIAGAFLPVDGGILTGWFQPDVYYEKFLGKPLKSSNLSEHKGVSASYSEL